MVCAVALRWWMTGRDVVEKFVCIGEVFERDAQGCNSV